MNRSDLLAALEYMEEQAHFDAGTREEQAAATDLHAALSDAAEKGGNPESRERVREALMRARTVLAAVPRRRNNSCVYLVSVAEFYLGILRQPIPAPVLPALADIPGPEASLVDIARFSGTFNPTASFRARWRETYRIKALAVWGGLHQTYRAGSGSPGSTAPELLLALAYECAAAPYTGAPGGASLAFRHWLLDALRNAVTAGAEAEVVPSAEDTVLTLVAAGDLVPGAADSCGALERAVTEALGEGVRAIVIDCRAVGRIQPEGLRTLVNIARLARRDGASIALCEVTRPIREVLAITKIDTVFAMAGTRAEAIAIVATPPAR